LEISREVGYPHGDRHRDCSQAGSEPKNQEQAPKTFNDTGQIRIQSWERDTKAHKKVGDFPDVSEVTLASHKELPKEIDSQNQQER
jgi:hypothetical protein